LAQTLTLRGFRIPSEAYFTLRVLAFVALVSLCAHALNSERPIVHGASRAQTAEEATSPKGLTTAQKNPEHSAFAARGQIGGQQVFEETWTTQQGAPYAAIQMAQTVDGYLWLGGTTGLFRFDGTRFERFHSSSGDRLLSASVHAVFAPSTGGLWVGYLLGGFSFVKNGHVKNYRSSRGEVNSFAEDSRGVIWAGTTSGVSRFNGSTWIHVGAKWAAPDAYSMLGFDRAGVLWVLVGFGKSKLFYLLPGGKRFQASKQYPARVYFTWDADENVVTSSISPEEARSLSAIGDPGLHTYPIVRKASQFIDRNNNLWIISPEPKPSLVRMRASNPQDFLAKPTSSNSETYNLDPNPSAGLVDREGNVWFADDHGVYRFFYSPFVSVKLNSSRPAAMAADEGGAIWIGFSYLGVNKLYRVTTREINVLPFSRQLDWKAAYHAPDKTLWFGESTGIWHIVDGKPLRIALPEEVGDQGHYLQAMTEDRAGGLWVSIERHGLFRWADGRWTFLGGRKDLPKIGVIRVEFTDCLRRVWFGYRENQVILLDGDKVRVFGPEDGIRIGKVTAIFGRGQGVWIGGEFGLQKFENGRFRTIQAVDNDWVLGITGIVETADGDLWLNGLTGVFQVGRAEIAKALNDPSYLVRGEHFGSREGLPGVAAQLRPLPTAVEGSDGTLWFSLLSGVFWLDPTRVRQKGLVPPVTIQSVSADDKNYEINSPLIFPAHTSGVAIRYSAISLFDPEAIRSRVKLRETDTNWHEVSTGEPVTYRNLAPGHYHFSVDVSDTNGVWSDKVANIDFTVLPAYYQTTGFRLLCVVFFLSVLWALYQFRLRQLAHKFNLTLEARVNERTRIARELHDTLLQSFHGLLFRIQAARNLLPRRPEEAIQALDTVIGKAEQAITEGRDAIQNLRAEPAAGGDLEHLLTATGQELAGSQDANPNSAIFRVIVEGTEETLAPILQDEIYRIAREVLRNAFVHASARKIEAEIRYDDRLFRLRIRDDGNGIDPKVLKRGRRAGHWGLPGIRERAKRIGARLDFWSEAGAGTEVELTVPATIAYETSRKGNGFKLFRKAGSHEHRS
jgi:signal transduction histidine kinase/ligand-binding sensor domain-containing protein